MKRTKILDDKYSEEIREKIRILDRKQVSDLYGYFREEKAFQRKSPQAEDSIKKKNNGVRGRQIVGGVTGQLGPNEAKERLKR